MKLATPFPTFCAAGSTLSGSRCSCHFSAPHRTRAVGHFSARQSSAFTLIELLIVVAIIAILAGLSIGIFGAANRSSAASRAQGEVAAIVGAIEDFRLAYGGQLPGAIGSGTNKTIDAKELVGDTGAVVNVSQTVFLEASQATYTNGILLDPWGSAYVYETNASGYDIYSTGGGSSENAYIRP